MKGMTLPELLISLGLSSLVAWAAFYLYTRTLSHVVSIDRKVEAQQTLDTFFRDFDLDYRRSTPLVEPPLFLTQPPPVFGKSNYYCCHDPNICPSITDCGNRIVFAQTNRRRAGGKTEQYIEYKSLVVYQTECNHSAAIKENPPTVHEEIRCLSSNSRIVRRFWPDISINQFEERYYESGPNEPAGVCFRYCTEYGVTTLTLEAGIAAKGANQRYSSARAIKSYNTSPLPTGVELLVPGSQ